MPQYRMRLGPGIWNLHYTRPSLETASLTTAAINHSSQTSFEEYDGIEQHALPFPWRNPVLLTEALKLQDIG